MVTAAHCLYAWMGSPESFSVTIGDQNIQNSDPKEKTFRVVNFEVHPDYTNDDKFDHDVAVIQLEHRVEWGTHAKPICMSNKDPEPNTTAMLVGWGYDTYRGSPTNDLHMAILNLWSNDDCQNSINRNKRQYGGLIVKSGHLCAGRREGGVDGCKVMC